MRITLEIDDEVIAAAQKLAAEQNTTVDRIISDAARNEFARAHWIMRNGFPVLPKTGRVLTPELVEQLLEEADLSDAGLPGAPP
jgi:predicted transcriptional regulator